MKNRLYLLTILFTILCLPFISKAQGDYEDVVYLKNGSIIHGMIIEQVPNQTIKIQTKDGNIFVFKIEEVEKMTKEKVKSSTNNKRNSNQDKDRDYVKNTDPHHGFQFSAYMGGAAGDITGAGPGIGKIVISGTSIHMRMHLGYANNNWAYGAAFGSNSLTPTTLTIRDTAYNPAAIQSIDNGFFGLYVTKYFMPLNLYVSIEGGTGNFQLYFQNKTTPFQTQRGFAWNIRVGKEFLIGRKGNWGLGGYVNLSHLTCFDGPPFTTDTYTYLGPGIGVSLSYH